MADESFPITPNFQFRHKGQLLALENRQLYTVLLLLWRRLGGAGGTPDLADLTAEVTFISDEIGNQQNQLTSLSDTLISEVLSLQSQINTLSIPAVDLTQVYAILTDMNEASAANADQAIDYA